MANATKRLGKATYVEAGFGQVEANHLSAQRNGQVYGQLPANKDIEMLENGQFVKYDYAKGEVNFTGDGEWMLVFNEIKIYKDREGDADFAMLKDNYEARVYNALGDVTYGHYNLTNQNEITWEVEHGDGMMPEGTTMVPRVLKTMSGDIMTTNTIMATTLSVGDKLYVGNDGYLTTTKASNSGDMVWQVAKVYNMPDLQKGVKIQRIA